PSSAPRPSLEHLDEADRQRAVILIEGLTVARGLDRHAARPSIDALLADTPFAGVADRPPARTVDPQALAQALRGVDHRAWVELDGDTVVFSYLDLRARFLLVAAEEPRVTRPVRVRVEAQFVADPDTSRVGVVAARSEDLATQLLAPDDLAATVT